MGGFFALLLIVVFVFIVSLVVALIGFIVVFFASNKEKRNKRILFMFISPFIGFYLIFILSFIGIQIVLNYKKVDDGIGDFRTVPLNNKCSFSYIDLPQNSFLEKNNINVVSNISKLTEIGNYIFLKLSDNTFYVYNSLNNKLIKIDRYTEFTKYNKGQKVNLLNVETFYNLNTKRVLGYWEELIISVSIIISFFVIYFLGKKILK